MDVKLKVDYLPTEALVPYVRNAKKHPEWQVRQIAASMEQFGNCDPVGVWHDADGAPVIVEGHGRVLAARLLGWKKVPCIALDHLDDDARRDYTHVHNQLAISTGLDYDALRLDIADLDGFQWEDFGFDASAVPVSIDGFSTDFALDSSDGAKVRTMTLTLDGSQLDAIERAISAVGECGGGGNAKGNAIAEVCRQWLAQRI